MFQSSRWYGLCLLVCAALVTFSFTVPTTETPTDNLPPRWEKLGQRNVNYQLDRDEIPVTARDGRFTKLRIRTEKSGINLHRFTIHFANGQTQTVEVNQSIAPNTTSRAFDLPGNKRIIQKVVFWYDTKNFARQRGRVELWGRH